MLIVYSTVRYGVYRFHKIYLRSTTILHQNDILRSIKRKQRKPIINKILRQRKMCTYSNQEYGIKFWTLTKRKHLQGIERMSSNPNTVTLEIGPKVPMTPPPPPPRKFLHPHSKYKFGDPNGGASQICYSRTKLQLQRLYFKHLQKKNTDLPEATKMTV
jgi:hypothetical protein